MKRMLLVALVACDPGWKIQGAVIRADTKAPIDGADVTLACAKQGPNGDRAKTDGTGNFSLGGVSGAFQYMTCTATITKTGFVPKTAGTTELCFRGTQTRDFTTPCDPKTSTIALAPIPP